MASNNDEFHLYVGQAIRLWAQLESILSLHLATFLNTDQFRARIVWANMPNLRSKRELLASFAETYLEDEPLQKYRGLLKRLKSLGKFRNTLAHSHVVWVDHGYYRFITDRADKEGGADFSHEERYQVNNIKTLSRAIKTLTQDFLSFHANMRVYASPKTHRKQQDDPTL